MIEKLYAPLILLGSMLATITLTACGGGGGGGDEGATATQGVRILHGAIEGAPVDVVATTENATETLVGTFRFAEVGLAPLEEGKTTISVRSRGSNRRTLTTLPLVATEGRTPNLLITGRPDEPFAITKILPTPPDDLADEGQHLRLVHGVSRAADILIVVNGRQFTQVGYGKDSAFLPVAATTSNTLQITALRLADSLNLGTAQIDTSNGQLWTVFFGGEAEAFSFARVIKEG